MLVEREDYPPGHCILTVSFKENYILELPLKIKTEREIDILRKSEYWQHKLKCISFRSLSNAFCLFKLNYLGNCPNFPLNFTDWATVPVCEENKHLGGRHMRAPRMVQQTPRSVSVSGRQQVLGLPFTPARLVIMQSEDREPWVWIGRPLESPRDHWHLYPLGILFYKGKHMLFRLSLCSSSILPPTHVCTFRIGVCLPMVSIL